MKIICPNLKNEEVAKEFEELKNATSEAAAYHIWSQNNGNGIDKAPNGEPSKLFSDLLEHYKGDRVAAIQAKARTYSKSFKEWFGDWQFENKNNVSKVVDENGEPLIVYSGRPTKGATTFNLESKRSRTHLTGLIKKGVYFTKDKQIAEMYSGSRDYASQLDRDMAKYRFGEDGGALSMTKEEFLEIFPDVTSQYYDEMMEKYNRVVNDPDNFTGEFFASKIDIEGEVIPAFLNLRNTTTVDMQGSTIAHLSKEQKESINNSEGAIIENVDENASGIALTSGITTTYVAFNPNQIKSIDNQGTFSTQDNNIYLADSNSENISQLESMQSYSNSKELLDNMDSEMAIVLNDVTNKINMQSVSIEYTDRSLNELYSEATYWTPAIYDRNTNKIVVNRNGDFSRYGSLENVLLHEITHAITLDSLAANTEAANELRAIQKEYAAKYSDHASENVYEFAAELFSNPDVIFNMQDFSASTGEKTLLQKLIDWFKRLFNKNTTHQDLINKIVDNVIEFNAYKTLEKREDTHDYIPDVLPAASKREEISAMRLRIVFNDLVKTAENRVASLKYNTIEDKFDRNETIRNDKLLSSLNMLKNSLKDAEDIENITNYLNGMLDYVDNVIYSLNEAESVIDRIDEQLMLAQQSNNVDQMNKLRTALDNFGAEYIYPHESNLRRIHDELNIEFNNNVFSSILGENEFNNIVTTINGLIAELSSSKMPNRKNIGYKFKNAVIRTVEKFLRDEMESAHDPSVDNSLMNWLTFDGDLKWYNRWLATPVSSPQFVYRLIRKTIGDVNNKTHKQVYNKYAELKIAASATSDHSKLFEKDINGKKTGYFIRDRRYGVYQNNKYEWRKKWLKDHKLASVDELKLNPDLWVQYQIDYNEWKSENAERRYTPEFYRIFANLSMEANMALSEVNLDIENLLKPFIDETTKKPRFEKMALDEYEQYLSLLEKKRNLANPYDPITGEIKPEGSSEYNIAMELTEAYEQLSKGLKSKVNMEAFLDEMEKMKKLQGYTPDGKYTLYEAWLERNTRWEFTEEFQNLISKQNKADYGEVYDKLYQARANLLKLYRTDRYEPDYTRMPQLVKDKIKELDIAMYKVRSKAHKKGGNQRLFKSELSQIAKDNGGKNAVLPEDIWVDDNGVKHYHSYMTTVKPVLDKYMHRVPNSNWAETSEEAAYYNHNYDRNIPEAEQPKLSKKEYDNRREFDAVMRDPALKHLYDVLINTMDESNDKISHAKYKNNYKLPQVTGSIFNYAASKGLITGTRDFMSDAFAINPDDELHGVRVETRPNGTEINIMPTMYTSMLTDPSVGTNDLIGAVIKYYRMACNYQNKKEVAPQLNLLDSIISKEGYINNGKTTVQAENSALSQEVHKYLGFHLYGRTANFKDVSVNGRKISLEKIYRYFADWGRDLGLAWNPRSAISGGVSAWSFYAADSFISKFINTRDFLIANRELAKELVTLKFLGQFGKNISNSKLMGVLELNGLSFNQEQEFSNTNRWRLGRMAKRLTEPYAVFKIASILPNSVFAIGTYLNYRLLELEDGKLHFISENDFLNHHFPDKSLKEKKAIYNNTKENLWGAYEMTKNGLRVKPKYAKYVNQDLENEVSSRLGAIASHAEGMVEEADKSGVYLSTALSSILMFRAFLPKNIENTLAPMYWNYQTKELAMGTLTAYWYAFNLQVLIGFNKNNYEKAVKLYGEDTVKKQVKSYTRRASAQILTYIFWLTLFNIFSLGGDDQDDYYWSNYMRLELKKISLESGSRYNPMDVLNILNSLTPLINTAEDLSNVFYPLAYLEERKWKKITKGSYKGLYGWQRDLLKINKYTNAYYNMKNPAEKLRNLSNTLN